MRCSSLRRLAFSLLALALLAGAAPAPAPAPPDAALSNEIDRLIDGGDAERAFWGIQIRDVDTGEVLYEHNPRRPFLPASNQKLLTTSTALDALGAGHRYKTTLYFDGEVDGSVLRGTLMIEGSGDPTFGSSRVRSDATADEVPSSGDALQRWAMVLAEMGITRIDGQLVGDDDVFDDRFYAEGWDVDYVTNQSSRLIGVSAGGLAYDDNLIRVHLRAGGVGEPPVVETQPAGFLNVRNYATTSARRRGRSLDLERTFGAEEITLRGTVPSGYAGTVFMPVTNPTLLTLHSFRADLRQAGIGVKNLDPVDIDDLREEPETDAMRPLFVHYSPPLRDILKTVNKESNNFYADQIFRSLSNSGTANASENRVKTLLEEASASTEAISIRDGSGLSRKDMVTPEVMTKLLAYMDGHPAHDAFLASLAQGGEANSTLKYRLKGQPVHAKTGSLEFARSLSGYATMPGGREVVFALFANNYAGPSYRVTQTFDRIVMALTS